MEPQERNETEGKTSAVLCGMSFGMRRLCEMGIFYTVCRNTVTGPRKEGMHTCLHSLYCLYQRSVVGLSSYL